MPRNVTRADPLIDPLAVWDAGQAAELPEGAAPVMDAASPDGRPESLPEPVVAPPPALHEMGALAQEACSNGHPLFHGARFCPECGVPAGAALPPEPSDWMCSGGHQNPSSAKFCPEDGSPAPWMTPPVTGAGVAVELAAQVQPGRPKPAEMLTPAERAERERLHAEAIRAGSQLPELRYETPQGHTEMVHMLEDGLTFAGQVWMRGQTIKLQVGSARWQEAQAWWHLTDFEQVDRYGKVMFRHGPWPGKRYEDAAGQYEQLASMDGKGTLAGPGVELLVQAGQRERARDGAVPAPIWR